MMKILWEIFMKTWLNGLLKKCWDSKLQTKTIINVVPHAVFTLLKFIHLFVWVETSLVSSSLLKVHVTFWHFLVLTAANQASEQTEKGKALPVCTLFCTKVVLSKSGRTVGSVRGRLILLAHTHLLYTVGPNRFSLVSDLGVKRHFRPFSLCILMKPLFFYNFYLDAKAATKYFLSQFIS